MYLARIAYVHVRNVVRHDMHDLIAFENNEIEAFGTDRVERFKQMRHSFNGECPSLIDIWATQIRGSIHNPVPRNEWGKYDSMRPFKWALVDGLWVKNHDFGEDEVYEETF